MTKGQIIKGLKNGSITLNNNGHYSWEYTIKHIIQELQTSNIFDTMRAMKNAGLLPDNYDIDLEEEKTATDIFKIGYSYDSIGRCNTCGELLSYKIIDNQLTMLSDIKHSFEDLAKHSCKSPGITPEVFNFEVTGPVIFANFFSNKMDTVETPKSNGKGTFQDYSLNTFFGIRNIVMLYADNNIGYQQTGNTYVDLFFHPELKEVLIVEPYADNGKNWDEIGFEEFEAQEELPKLGYEYLGGISCDMWRYMFANKSDLNEKDLNDDDIEAILPLGIYKVENLYQRDPEYNQKISYFEIASRIKLIDQ